MAIDRRSRLHVAILSGAVLVVCAFALMQTIFTHAHGGSETVIPMTVKRFEYSLREIRLKKGVPVVLEITSLDVPHGFNLPDFGVRADVVPGMPARVRLVPDKVGTYTFRCDVFCGSGHEDLDGTVVVSE
ncbi:MAG TPA: cupredoxin domain-containing protein [Burkholderiales bacterium]|nr:cupredoxin domain-containing protein [Burkholderiales bacterium]